MAVYYNEIDAYAAQWLRNLIKAGHIADGEVDTRSIVNVQPDDLRGFAQCHFFAGIAGWGHALRLAGWPDERPIWTGSCPCQPFSVAGKGKGADDPRHLWPHFFRLIAACRPPVVMGEQVAGAAGYGWLDGVRYDLEGEGYACEGVDIPACAVNAPHIRQRLYWVGVDNTDGAVRTSWGGDGVGIEPSGASGRSITYSSDAGIMADADSELRDGRRNIWPRGRDEHTDGSRSSDMADADIRSCGKRGVELRGQTTAGEPCVVGEDGDMVDADGRGRIQTREWGSLDEIFGGELYGGVPIEERGSRGDMVDAEGVGRREGRTEHEVRSGRAAIASASGGDMADADDERPQGVGSDHDTAGRRRPDVSEAGLRDGAGFWSSGVEWRRGADGKERRVKSGVRLLASGIPNRVGRLRAYGNAIAPPLAAEVIKAFMDTEHGA